MKKIEPPFVRNPYNYDANQVSRETGLKCEDPSLAQQQFLEESDINFIADRYGLTGELPQLTGANAPTWGGDFAEIFDFQGAQNAVIRAREDFMTLPAKIRARFDNDPGKLLASLDRAKTDPEERAILEAIGVVDRKVPTPPVESNSGVPGKPEGHPEGSPTPTEPKAKGGAAPKPPKSDT